MIESKRPQMEWITIRNRRTNAVTHAVFLVLSLVFSELSLTEASLNDFVCYTEARKVMNRVKELEQELVSCSAARSLSSPVNLPCTKLHMASWGKKTISERRAEILQSLRTLAQDVQRARTPSQAGCALTLLQNLQHNVNNYVLILTQLQEQDGFDRPLVPECTGQLSQDLGLVLKHFGRLISGKLELLIRKMAETHTQCSTTHTLKP